MIALENQDPRLVGLVAVAVLLAVALLIAWRRTTAYRQDAARREAEAQTELARLTERTARLARLDEEMTGLQARQGELLAETARLQATLSERDNEARRLEQELGQSRAQAADAHGKAEEELASWRETAADLGQKLGASDAALKARSVEADGLRAEVARLAEQRDDAARLLGEARERLSELRSRGEEERKAAAEKIELLLAARAQLTDQFKALANDILEEKTRRFTEQNHTALGAILDPLRTQLSDFKGKVEEVYVNEAKERSALGEQVRQLMGLNQQLSKDAHNLTSALRGQSKAQGNWGELVLERILEAGGLVKGIHYEPQESHARDDGSRAQPDVVLRLPGDRYLVIDAKVSLNAYDDFVNGEEEARKDAALKRHLDSVRNHIRELSAKNYQDLYGLSSLDFVVMFVPIEPAFLVAITRDSELWQHAWVKNIMLVSPSSLLFVVRIVAQLWQKEQQTRNAQEIARRGAELYDKLVGFVDDLDKVGKGLKQAQDAYDRASLKFARGKGNAIRQAEMLKGLGVKPTRQLDPALVETAFDDDSAALPSPAAGADGATPPTAP
jgi:DNA recombination protein RmuC